MDDSNKNSNKKPPMTETERLALAEKLDKDLDDFIASLPKRQPTERNSEENWEEEILKHPFFMKKTPEPGEELHPLYEGLQQLKYDPNENTPEDLANSYKEDGNFNFKYKKYRLAVLSYTEGIKVKCNNEEIEATLHNNRAAANFFLKNYRSCLRDCEIALKFKPKYTKAMVRAANACFLLENYAKAVDFCDELLEENPTDKDIQILRQKCLSAANAKLRDLRKREMLFKKKENEEKKLLEVVTSRKLHFAGDLTLKNLQPIFEQLSRCRVHLDETQNLVWPVVFFYPQYSTMDFVQNFCETDTLSTHINEIFATYPEWDLNREYKPGCLNVYVRNSTKTQVSLIDSKQTLNELLKREGTQICNGTPEFYLIPSKSSAEQKFLETIATKKFAE